LHVDDNPIRAVPRDDHLDRFRITGVNLLMNQVRRHVNKIARPGFGHVFALCEPSPDVTLIVNPQPGRVETLTIEGPPYHLLRQYGGGGCRVMVVEMAPSVVALVPRGWAVTCASYVAYAAGISFRGVTPFQLYRRIIKLGGEQVWEKQ